MLRTTILAMLLLPVASAGADEARPVEPALPIVASPSPSVAPAPRLSLTLPAGKLNVTLTLELDASEDKVAEPISIAPDLGYGVTDDLTLAVVHSKFALTGFRAVAGGGICLSGSGAGCATAYNNVGTEAAYSLARGQVAFAAVGGLHVVDLDNSLFVAKLGGRARFSTGKVALNSLPSVLIALDKRTDAMGTRLNKDILYVPVQLTYRITRPLLLGLGTGIKGPISGFGDAWQVPIGVTAVYAIDPSLAIGASWTFGQLLGGATNPPDPAPAVKGPELRGIQLWASYTI